MPRRYGFKRSYRTRRSYRKRKANSFSRYNTYRKRSSKAQAYQIYRLNKKINHVYKMTKPEIQIYTDDANNNGTPHLDVNLTTSETSGYKTGCVPIINRQDNCFTGHYARIRDVSITGTLEFIGNPSETAQAQTCGLRLIFFRLRSDIYGAPSRTDIMKIINSKPNNYYLNCPLESGFSTRYKLVRDFRTVLTPTSGPTKSFRIRFKYPYALLSKAKLETEGSTYSRNSLWCLYYICRAGTFNGSSVDTFSFNGYLKFAYTDDIYTSTEDNNSKAKDVDEYLEVDDADEETGMSQESDNDVDEK